MRLQITPICGGRKVELRETRRAVTPFGGLVVFGEFLGKIGYAEAVRKHLPFRLTSPNAIDPVQTLTAGLSSGRCERRLVRIRTARVKAKVNLGCF